MDIRFGAGHYGKVRIVDDDDGFRKGLTRVLNASGLETVGYRCVGEYLIAESKDSPGCVLLDVCLPGPSGLELWDALTARDLSPPTIFISGCGDVSISVRAMKAGAIDFMTKPVQVPRLLDAVRYALSLDAERRAEHMHRREITQMYETLQGVERAVFAGVVDGKLNKQLAGELNMCERTIKTYRAQMMSKFRATSLPELVRIARLLSRPIQKMSRIGFSHGIEPRLNEARPTR
jgi:FixJ family two-component response regulator